MYILRATLQTCLYSLSMVLGACCSIWAPDSSERFKLAATLGCPALSSYAVNGVESLQYLHSSERLLSYTEEPESRPKTSQVLQRCSHYGRLLAIE